MAKISLLGTGSWGIALGLVLCDNGHSVQMWSAFKDEVEMLKKYRSNEKLLPNVKIPQEISFTDDISCISNSDAIVFCVPSYAIEQVTKLAKPYIRLNTPIINAGKGIDPESGLCFSKFLSKELKTEGIAVISGPTHAEEVSKKVPTSAVISCKDLSVAEYARDLFMNDYFRIYVNDDVTGTEIGGAMKNIIALCVGICDGLGMGDNTKAALMTRGLAEITRLGIAMGGKSETFMGLAGMGDLIVTCCSNFSRNHRAGELIGSGMSPKEAISKVGTVEGFYALETAHKLSFDYSVELPITNACYEVFHSGLSPKDALSMLMTRPKKSEKIQ